MPHRAAERAAFRLQTGQSPKLGIKTSFFQCARLASMDSQSRYDHLPREALIALLERRDARRAYGLVWEREGIAPDAALNEDFVALDLDASLSTARADAQGWRNLVIEGDNWDALRALRLTCAGRVKVILIDPPYNTGNRDFVFNDRFVGLHDRYRQSVWLEFLYRRLVVARDLFADDGVILVCINDENRARLDLLMEQVFPGMRLGSFVWRTKDTNNSDKRRNWSGVHEHILIYANQGFGFIGPDAGPGKFRLRPEYGDIPVRLDPVTSNKTFQARENTYYPIQDPATGLWYPAAPNQVWRFWSEAEVERQKQEAKPNL
jgi:adenine-specific DNA-methyltransferase